MTTTCNPTWKSSNHHARYVTGGGFHWNLHTELAIIDFNIDMNTINIIEKFPPGIFIDVDQLRDIEQFPPSPKIISVIPSTVDIEKPMELASPITLTWSPTWISEICHTSENIKFKVIKGIFPIHLRYHAPSNNNNNQTFFLSLGGGGGGGHATVHLPTPIYQNTKTKSIIPTSSLDLQFHVPIGNGKSETFVTMITSLIVILATLALIKVTITTNKNTQITTTTNNTHRRRPRPPHHRKPR
jgi:hypothetical protein